MTEGWCYGSMSVVAPRKGHYCHRGLWEMTPDVLLLILALTACLTEPVRSEEDDGSGVQEKEAQVAKQMTSMTTIIHTSEVISVSDNPITVSTQEEEVSGLAETLAQVTSEKNSTEISTETDTKARNVTTEVKHDKGRKLPTNDTAGDEEDHQEEDENMGSSPEPEKTDDQETYIIVAASVTLAVLLAASVVGLLFLCRRRRKNTPDPEKDDPYLDDEYEEKVPMPMFEDDMPSVMELEMEDFEKWMIKGGGDISMESKQRHPS